MRSILSLCRAIALVALGLLWSSAGAASDWPERPVRIVVPFAPGGSNDGMARVLSARLGTRLGQAIVIENRGGSGGTLGTDHVAKSAADGYTILFVSTSIITNVASGKPLPYDPVKDLQPVGMVATSPFAVVVPNGSKAGTLREFFDIARANPKRVSYGSAGVGGINHLGTELLASEARLQLVHVPYKGIGPAFNDLMGGNLQMLLPTLASVTQHIRLGRLRGLAVTGAQRSPLAPDLPTVAEAGVPGFELEAWFGLLVPALTPAAVVRRLNEELNAVLAQPEVQDLLAHEGATPRPGPPEALGNLIRSDLRRWSRLIKDARLQLE
jgi:tripartite-type tricarboxylate transporter receptor subunit TctC